MKPFRERNPIPIGVISITVILGLLFLAFNVSRLPLLTNDASYSALFREAAGIEKENEVRLAGVRVGTVTRVALDGDVVRVDFRVARELDLGNGTTAAIKLKTLLGTKFLEIRSAGAGELAEGATIPVERTEVPFQIYEAFDQLSGTLDDVDVETLSKAFKTLSDTFKDTGGNAPAALRGLSRLSQTISSRDAELRRLLSSTRVVTGALAARDVELTRLLGDADLVLRTIQQRREIISALLRSTSELAAELTSLVRANRAQLNPLLADLHSVVEVLRGNLSQLDRSVELLGPFARYGANATGSGRWLDVYSENLVISDEILCQLGAC